jgi:hypothetical protein
VKFTGVELAIGVELAAPREGRDRISGEGHGGLPTPRHSHPCLLPRRVALLACKPPEPPFPPTHAGLGAVVAFLVRQQSTAGRGKRSGRRRCGPQERRRAARQQPDARRAVVA